MVKKSSIILSVILIILFVTATLIYNYKNPNVVEEIKIPEVKYKLLDDYSRFFTVNSCIYKYVTYLQTSNVENILKVLNQDYINQNNLNSSNVLDYVDKLNGVYSFVSKKMYYEEIDENYIKYYVYGNLVQDTIDEYGEKVDKYYIVTLDINNQLFDITPFDQSGFKEVSNES